MKCKLLVLIVVNLISIYLVGQDALTIDPITKKINGDIPFDRYFDIKLPDALGLIDNAFVFKTKLEDGDIVTRKRLLYKAKVSPDKETKKTTLKLKPINPNTSFEIILVYRFKEEDILRVFWDYRMGIDVNDTSLIMLDLIKKLESGRERVGITTTVFGGRSWYSNKYHELKCFYNSNIKVHFDNIDSRFNTLASSSNLTRNNLKKIILSGKANKINTEYIQRLWNIIDNGNITDLQKGLVAHNKDFTKLIKAKEYDISDRIKNLNLSLDFIYQSRVAIEKIDLLDPLISTEATNVLTQLRVIETDIESDTRALKSQLKSINEKVKNEYNIRYGTLLYGDNYVSDLKSLGSYYIIPDLGFAFISEKGLYKKEVFPRPYWGVSIYLRPVDKNIRFKDLNAKLLHRTSINLGLSFIEINDEEVSDFYNKMSLLTGVNFKLTRALSLSAGAAWINKTDINPLIDKNTVVARPYFGISVDVDFANALSKITGKIGY